MKETETPKDVGSPTKNFIKVFTLIYFALLFGMVAFALVVLLITANWHFAFSGNSNILLFIVPIYAVIIFFISGFVFKTVLQSAKKQSTLKHKLMGYQTASIIKFALIESAALLATVASLLSSNLFFMVVFILIFLFYLTQKPSAHKIEKELDLTGDMKYEFQAID